MLCLMPAVDLATTEPPRIFLAGGVSGPVNWQEQIIRDLCSCERGTLLNPRRPNSHSVDAVDPRQQIQWEFRASRTAEMIAFWFSRDELNPITLFELGAQLQRIHDWPAGGDPAPVIRIGVDGNYLKPNDVRIQTDLVLPGTRIVTSLDDLIGEIAEFADKFTPKYSATEATDPVRS